MAAECVHVRLQVPEMRRVPLEELCLQIKAMGYIDTQAFLSKAMDPPTDRAVAAALQTLTEVPIDHKILGRGPESRSPTSVLCVFAVPECTRADVLDIAPHATSPNT